MTDWAKLAAEYTGRRDAVPPASPPPDVRRSQQCHRVSTVSTPAETKKPARARSSHARITHRLWAIRFPDDPTPEAETLVAEARRYGSILVADGPELVLVEDRTRLLPAALFGRISRHAGSIISVLRTEHARRIEDGRAKVFVFDPPDAEREPPTTGGRVVIKVKI